MDSMASPKVKTMEGERIEACSLACNTSWGVEGRVGACWSSGMGLGRTISNSIIHMYLYKINNKLVNVKSKHSWCMDDHGQARTHKTHHDLDLGEAITFPLIVFSMLGHWANTQMLFCSRTPKWES
jgi:hypothetical protein